VADLVTALVEQHAGGAQVLVGTVTGVVGAQVTVSLFGGSLTLGRLASYVPAVGHTVVVLRAAGASLVLGNVAV
jgi:hypothetical protein